MAGWQDQVYDLLRQKHVTQFAYVPDAGHHSLIDRSLADPQVNSVAMTPEEEGVALLAGADLGGARGVLLLQSSGVGNCINTLSLTSGGRYRSVPRYRARWLSRDGARGLAAMIGKPSQTRADQHRP
jgi:sulfopyruvate decarboxylase TPP-binding subunit